MLDAVDSEWISGGAYHSRLTDALIEFHKMPYGLLTSNGTTALHLAMLVLDLKPGDEVIVPGFCFLAAANIAKNMHLKPVFAEVDNESWLVTAETIEACISPRTRVIVPVHTYGNVCDMVPIMELAKDHNIFVVEDCAEALFSTYEAEPCGTFGDINCFSFQATKTITTGEGGFVTTRNEAFYEGMKLYHSHGLAERGRYEHRVHGLNFRLTNLQSAIGLAQFEQKEGIISARKKMHEAYIERLGSNEHLILQKFVQNVNPVLWAFAVRLREHVPITIGELSKKMADNGIETRPGFIAPGLLDIFDQHGLETCELLSNRVISLPSYPTLEEEQIQEICDIFCQTISRSLS